MHFAREKGLVSTVVYQRSRCYTACYRRFLQYTLGNVHSIGVLYRHEPKILAYDSEKSHFSSKNLQNFNNGFLLQTKYISCPSKKILI
jgi:hypothetical protein